MRIIHYRVESRDSSDPAKNPSDWDERKKKEKQKKRNVGKLWPRRSALGSETMNHDRGSLQLNVRHT